MSKDNMCQDSSEQAESKGSGPAVLPNYQPGPEKGLGQLAKEMFFQNRGMDSIRQADIAWSAAARAVASKARDSAIEECAVQLEHRAELCRENQDDEGSQIYGSAAHALRLLKGGESDQDNRS